MVASGPMEMTANGVERWARILLSAIDNAPKPTRIQAAERAVVEAALGNVKRRLAAESTRETFTPIVPNDEYQAGIALLALRESAAAEECGMTFAAEIARSSSEKRVGAARFELAAPCTPSKVRDVSSCPHCGGDLSKAPETIPNERRKSAHPGGTVRTIIRTRQREKRGAA